MTQANSILDRRRAGVLLHITSLPGGAGNGDLGADALRFVDWLSDLGLSIWQTLPINPTHPDGSPYQCLSVHAGSPLLIDPRWFVEKGWLARFDPGSTPIETERARRQAIADAFKTFQGLPESTPERVAFREFVADHQWWLDDYALFMAVREECGQDPWQQWPASLRDRWPAALAVARRRLAADVSRFEFEQFVFHTQWNVVRDYARQKGVLLFGDMPIFVAGDSADVWASRQYFDLTPEGQPRVVAGVPPDYFSATGQRWGNPHYDWAVMEGDGFQWWLGRLRSQFALYDWVRIDHFRGFEAYWEIPADAATAIEGRWVKAPGERLLETALRTFARDGTALPLIAEDLGVITPEVDALRDRFALPGMKILQFAFDGGPENPYLPHNYPPNCVVYTGTHDNDTTVSWFAGLKPEEQQHVYAYLGFPEIPMPEALIRSALASDARLAMIPMQDLLALGAGHRMNTPGTLSDANWRWRFAWPQLSPRSSAIVADWIRLYGRAGDKEEEPLALQQEQRLDLKPVARPCL